MSRPHRTLVNPGVTFTGRCSAKIFSAPLRRKGRKSSLGSRWPGQFVATSSPSRGRGPIRTHVARVARRGSPPLRTKKRAACIFLGSLRPLHFSGSRLEKYLHKANVDWSLFGINTAYTSNLFQPDFEGDSFLQETCDIFENASALYGYKDIVILYLQIIQKLQLNTSKIENKFIYIFVLIFQSTIVKVSSI